MNKQMIDEILASKEFKDFVKLVASHTGRTVDSYSVESGGIVVDGFKFCVPQLNNDGNITYLPAIK